MDKQRLEDVITDWARGHGYTTTEFHQPEGESMAAEILDAGFIHTDDLLTDEAVMRAALMELSLVLARDGDDRAAKDVWNASPDDACRQALAETKAAITAAIGVKS